MSRPPPATPPPLPPPPLSAAEALSSLLWQPYECRAAASSPPVARLARSFTDDFLAARRARGAPAARAQSPCGGRHARTRTERAPAHRSDEMRLAVPAPAARKCAVTVRVPGETSACANVSSVHIVPEQEDSANGSEERGRSYASAECQTEEPSRRRRVRRVRPAVRAQLAPELDAHVPPPPYSTLPHAAPPHVPPAPHALHAPPAAPAALPPALLATAAPATHRFPFQPIPVRRSGRSAAYACSESGGAAPKSCCGLRGARPPLRWCVLLVGVAGVCCVATGAALGALRPHPHTHLTLLLLMIGVGVVLMSVAGLAWRLSARDAPPCRALLGLQRASCGRRLVPRLPPSYARPHHPYAAMLYPEFHYRPPPPTYQASMQEYRLRLLLLDRGAPAALSPPPMYRSNTASLVRGSGLGVGWCGSDYSGPPSYRGAPRAPSAAPPTPPASLAGVVLDNIGVDTFTLKYADDNHIVLPTSSKREKDDHLVTIVQTGEDVQPVIVTVSGEVAESEHVRATTEIDILAHL